MGLIGIFTLFFFFTTHVHSQGNEKSFGPLSYGMSEEAVRDELAKIGMQSTPEPPVPLALKQTFNNSGIHAWYRLESEKNLQIFEGKTYRGRVVEQIAEIVCCFVPGSAAANLGMDQSKGLQAVILIFDPLEKDCLRLFETLQNIVTEGNGTPTKIVKEYEEPFHEQDGYTEAAIKAGKCVYEATWRLGEGNRAIWLRVEKNMNVTLYYQSSVFAQIMYRDLKNKKELL